MKEIWKDIEGYEGLYQVSNFGVVISNYKKKKKVMKTTTNKCGYFRVGLTKNRKMKLLLVHRLVAQAFIPNPDNKKEINHIDRNKENNYVSNLEWVSHKENIVHATKTGKWYRGKPVLQIKNGIVIKEYSSVLIAKKENHCSDIGLCVLGLKDSARGYVWRFK